MATGAGLFRANGAWRPAKQVLHKTAAGWQPVGSGWAKSDGQWVKWWGGMPAPEDRVLLFKTVNLPNKGYNPQVRYLATQDRWVAFSLISIGSSSTWNVDVSYSDDGGLTWTLTDALLPAANFITTPLVWQPGGGLLVYVNSSSGASNPMWTSADGVTWTNAGTSTGFTPANQDSGWFAYLNGYWYILAGGRRHIVRTQDFQKFESVWFSPVGTIYAGTIDGLAVVAGLLTIQYQKVLNGPWHRLQSSDGTDWFIPTDDRPISLGFVNVTKPPSLRRENAEPIGVTGPGTYRWLAGVSDSTLKYTGVISNNTGDEFGEGGWSPAVNYYSNTLPNQKVSTQDGVAVWTYTNVTSTPEGCYYALNAEWNEALNLPRVRRASWPRDIRGSSLKSHPQFGKGTWMIGVEDTYSATAKVLVSTKPKPNDWVAIDYQPVDSAASFNPTLISYVTDTKRWVAYSPANATTGAKAALWSTSNPTTWDDRLILDPAPQSVVFTGKRILVQTTDAYTRPGDLLTADDGLTLTTWATGPLGMLVVAAAEYNGMKMAVCKVSTGSFSYRYPVYYTTDGGNNWLPAFTDTIKQDITSQPALFEVDGTFLLSYSSGTYASTDGAHSQKVTTPFTRVVSDASFTVNDSGVTTAAYIALTDGTLWKATGGFFSPTWTQVTNTPHTTWTCLGLGASGSLLCAAGNDGTTTVYDVLDTTTGKWTPMAGAVPLSTGNIVAGSMYWGLATGADLSIAIIA